MALYSLFCIAVTALVAWTSVGLLAFCHLEHRRQVRIVQTTDAAILFALAVRWPWVLWTFRAARLQAGKEARHA